MFDPEFFPTPAHVIQRMNINPHAKHILEPSAGSGNIVEWLQARGAASVVACEKQPELRRLVSFKCPVIKEDFFQVAPEEVSHVQLIVMNPPFSVAAEHILQAWTVAPEGCEIVALCNQETINKHYHSQTRQQLAALIRDYGTSEELGKCFSDADRQTDVEVGLIRLFKPVLSENANWEGFFLEQDEEQQGGDGMIVYSDVRALVNTYVAAVRSWDRYAVVAAEMNSYTDALGFGNGFKFEITSRATIQEKGDFARKLQAHCWGKVFQMLKVEKWVTSGVMEDVNKFIHSHINYPFSLRNIYRMVEIIIGTREHTMKRAICEAVDNLTQHTHENRFGVEGWKTNAGHCLNQKFIVDYMVEVSYRGCLRLNSGQNRRITDLTKAICYLQGINADEVSTLAQHFAHMEIWPGKWYCCGFFDFKAFKKGTMHFKFQRREDWEILNRTYAKIKGQVLPEKI